MSLNRRQFVGSMGLIPFIGFNHVDKYKYDFEYIPIQSSLQWTGLLVPLVDRPRCFSIAFKYKDMDDVLNVQKDLIKYSSEMDKCYRYCLYCPRRKNIMVQFTSDSPMCSDSNIVCLEQYNIKQQKPKEIQTYGV